MVEEILALTKVSSNLQTRVPKEVCEKLGLSPGDRILWILDDGKIRIKKA